MPNDRPKARGFTAQSAPSGGLRPLDYFLLGICVVALIAVGVLAARGSSQAQQAAFSEKAAKDLKTTLGEMEGQVKQLRAEVQSLRGLHNRLSTLETRVNENGDTRAEIRRVVREAIAEDARTRQAQFRAEMDQRGEEFVNRLANDKRIEEGLREAVRRMRKQTEERNLATDQPAEPTEQAVAKADAPEAPDPEAENIAEKKKADPIEEGIAEGAQTLADGLKLWREFQQGKITKEEFDAKRKNLENNLRAAFEKNMTPEQRDQMRKRIEEWRNRRRGGGGAAQPPRPVDENF